jgi:hypothetical protein
VIPQGIGDHRYGQAGPKPGCTGRTMERPCRSTPFGLDERRPTCRRGLLQGPSACAIVHPRFPACTPACKQSHLFSTRLFSMIAKLSLTCALLASSALAAAQDAPPPPSPRGSPAEAASQHVAPAAPAKEPGDKGEGAAKWNVEAPRGLTCARSGSTRPKARG